MGFLSKAIGVSDKLLGGFWSDQSGKSQQDDANKMAMQSWTLANDYNHPVQQMERLKAAGLNPNLVYGSGSVAGNTTSAPSLVGGGVLTGTESVFRGLNNIMSIAQNKATLDNTHAQTQASSAAAGASAAQAANLNQQTAVNTQEAKYREKSLIADIDYKRALADKTQAEATISQAEANLFEPVAGVKGAELLKNVGKGVLSIAKKLPAGALVGRMFGR